MNLGGIGSNGRSGLLYMKPVPWPLKNSNRIRPSVSQSPKLLNKIVHSFRDRDWNKGPHGVEAEWPFVAKLLVLSSTVLIRPPHLLKNSAPTGYSIWDREAVLYGVCQLWLCCRRQQRKFPRGWNTATGSGNRLVKAVWYQAGPGRRGRSWIRFWPVRICPAFNLRFW